MHNNILLVFAIQVISEFLPISSSLFLETLGMEEGVIFHVFSGMMITIIYFPHIWNILRYPLKHKHTIQVYFWAILPSAVIGYLTNMTNTIFVVNNLLISIVANLIAGLLLFLMSLYRLNDKEFATEQKLNKDKNHLTIPDGFIIGILTSLNGIIPGLSRLGTGLTYLMWKKKNMSYANKVLFVTSIPISMGKPIVHFIKYSSSWHLFLEFIFTQHIYAFIIGLITIYIFNKIKHLSSYRVVMYVALLRLIYYSSYLIYKYLV